jgi:hypothetical protein
MEDFESFGEERGGDGAERGGRLDAAPGVARIAAGAGLRTVGWYASTAMRATRRLTKAAVNRESPFDLAREAREELLDGVRTVLGVTEIERRLGGLGSTSGASAADADEPLRQRGTALLDRSSELSEHGDAHPAYARILEQLSPDEARILRLLAAGGPQPAVDIRNWRPLDIGSHTVAPGLSMIGKHAGVIRQDRVPAYLSNLFRLGLIWFSRDELREPGPYQVLEAQPDVIDAIKATGRARVVRRSIHLTPFGGHFCATCLPVSEDAPPDLQPIDAAAAAEPQ